jgi:hypothetical protein
MKKTAVFLILVVLSSSCNLIAKKMYRIKKPKNEDALSIKSFLNKNKVDTTNVYVFNSALSFSNYSKQQKMTVPGALFFDKFGNSLEYNKNANTCTKNITSFINDLKSFSSNNVNGNLKFNQVLNFLKPISRIDYENDADINVFILWTVYLGKLNKENTYEWISLLKKAKTEGVKVNYYLLNCDLQKEWDTENNSATKLKLN